MKVTYKFSSLASLADYLDNKAQDLRAIKSKRLRDAHQRMGEAFAHEQIAHLLRHAVIEEPIGAIMPDGTRLDTWDERLRAAGGSAIYPGDQ